MSSEIASDGLDFATGSLGVENDRRIVVLQGVVAMVVVLGLSCQKRETPDIEASYINNNETNDSADEGVSEGHETNTTTETEQLESPKNRTETEPLEDADVDLYMTADKVKCPEGQRLPIFQELSTDLVLEPFMEKYENGQFENFPDYQVTIEADGETHMLALAR